MSEDKIAAMNLARNTQMLRKRKNLSQRQLAAMADIPRSTLTNIESGDANPSLNNLAKLSAALGVGIEELLSRPRSECKLICADRIPVRSRGRGQVSVYKLMPERIKGLEIDRLEIEPGASMGGTPHVRGTKEYLHCISGRMTTLVAGEAFEVAKGDVLAFPGDQRHSYRNRGTNRAIAISVVVPVPLSK